MRACGFSMLALAMACAGCTGDSASGNGLTGPSAPVVSTVNHISILDVPSSLPTGRTATLVAVGNYPDGSQVDVTHNVTWVSSNTSACTVSRDGVVTANGTGTATITASIATHSGTASIVCGYVVTIAVHENAPTTNVAIDAATVTAVDGPLQGQSFATNGQGQIVLPPVSAGNFSIRVEANGYDTLPTTVPTLLRETTVGVELMQQPTVHEVYTPGPCGGSVYPLEHREVTFTSPRQGRWRLQLEVPGGTPLDEMSATLIGPASCPGCDGVDINVGSPGTTLPSSGERVLSAGRVRLSITRICTPVNSNWRVTVDGQR